MARNAYYFLPILIGALLCSSPPAAAQSPAELLVSKARALEARGRLDLAIQAWQQLLLLDPQNEDALAGLARASRQSGRPADARNYLDRLRAINPKHPLLVEIGNQAALQTQQPLLDEAGRLAAAGSYDQAVAKYRQAFGGDTPPPGALTVAFYETLAGTTGGWEKATAALDALVKRSPDQLEYKFALGRLYTYRPATRLQGLDLLASLPPNSPVAQRAQAAWRQGLIWENGSPRTGNSLRAYLARYPDAEIDALSRKETAARPAGATGPVPTNAAGDAGDGIDLRPAYDALRKDDLAVAEARFADAVKKSPKNGAALTGLGFVRMKQQNFAEAVKLFESARANGASSQAVADAAKESRFWLAMQQGANAIKERRSADAETAYVRALEERPDQPDALAGYAGALMQRSNAAAAIPVLDHLLRVDKNNTFGWTNLVRARDLVSGPQAALDTVSRMPDTVSKALSTNVEYLATLSALYREAGKSDEARRTFERAAQIAKSTRLAMSAGLQQQMAGLHLEYGEAVEAAKLYKWAIDAQPDNLDAWEGFLLAMERAKEPRAALTVLEKLPNTAFSAAQARPGFLRALAAIEASAGNTPVAERLLQKALDLETEGNKPPSIYTQLQMAQVLMTQNRFPQAAEAYNGILQTNPENAEAAKGRLLALYKDKRYDAAIDAANRLTPDVSARLRNDPEYLSILASVYQQSGFAPEALQLVREAVGRYQSERRHMPAEMAVQFGYLLLNQPGNEQELYLHLRNTQARTDLSAADRRSVNDIWVNWLLQASDTANNTGDPARAVAILQSGVRMLPAEGRLQRALAGLLLANGDSRRAYALYRATSLRDAAASEYLGAIGAALAERDRRTADAWLNEGLLRFPNDPELLSLAGKQAALRGDFKRAEAYWRIALQSLEARDRQQGLMDVRERLGSGAPALTAGRPVDDLAAVLLAGNPNPAAPANPMVAAAPSARLPWETAAPAAAPVPAASAAPLPTVDPAARAANSLLDQIIGPANPTVALVQSEPSVRRDPPLPPTPSAFRTTPVGPQAVSQPLVPAAPVYTPAAPVYTPAPAAPASSSRQSVDQLLNALTSPEGRSSLRRELAQEDRTGLPAARAAAPANALGSSALDRLLSGARAEGANPLTDLSVVGPADRSPRDSIRDQIETIESRNTPYAGLGDIFQVRNGDAGFTRLTMQETHLEASILANQRVRINLVAKPTFLETGSPTGDSEFRFGLLPVGDTFSAQSVTGFGAEVQLATTNFGMRFGTTPRAFNVKNYIGGVRFRPGGGPITLMYDRDSVRDTFTSFAGSRDPVSNRVWGGVIADTGSLAGSFGDERSGAYFNIGYQRLTGQNVASNRRIDGTVGGYWRLLNLPAGSLNAGVNLFAMHYEKNLRFFTFGHGGYFSPQRFILFNVPVSWNGKWRQLEYRAATSIGSQAFREDASAYFPTDPLLQGRTGPYYPEYSSSGINYNVDFRAGYQITDHWHLGGFLNFNNARFYSVQAVGVFAKYSFQSRPVSTDLSVPSIPDWRGRQPFGLP